MDNKYQNIYIAIDLKSFYASVECQERGLNPLTTNLVVADSSRTEKTICLAVSPSLKQYGIPGRARLYEVVQKVKEINEQRKFNAPNHTFTCSSYDDIALKNNNDLELAYIVAPPRMSYYMQYSTRIVDIYLKWFSMEDIYVYSIDEVFIDVTHYLQTYNCTPRELATKVIQDVLKETGITATCGIGTNMYLAKVAMDIVAKHTEADKYGVRIAGLDEFAYRKYLWNHKPLTDIDHAWGYEPCTIDSVKSYKPVTNCLSSGQVLKEPYDYNKTRLIVKEMAELLSLDLVKKDLITSKLVLEIGYDICNLSKSNLSHFYDGEIKLDHYGREVPKHAHGTINIDHKTASTKIITDKFVELYDNIINKDLYVRRVTLTACDVVNEDDYKNILTYEQMDMFIDYNELAKQRQKERAEKSLQKAVLTVLNIKSRYGKNAILKGMNFVAGGTTIERNGQIGGHRS